VGDALERIEVGGKNWTPERRFLKMQTKVSVSMERIVNGSYV